MDGVRHELFNRSGFFSGVLYLLFQIVGEKIPEMGMCFNQTSDVCKIFDAFALSSFWFGPCFHLSFESILSEATRNRMPCTSAGTALEA